MSLNLDLKTLGAIEGRDPAKTKGLRPVCLPRLQFPHTVSKDETQQREKWPWGTGREGMEPCGNLLRSSFNHKVSQLEGIKNDQIQTPLYSWQLREVKQQA